MPDERRLPPGLKYIDLPPRSEEVRCPACGAEPPHLPGSLDCLRRQLEQAQAEIERMRREREMLAEAVRAMKYFFDSDYSDPEESATVNWSYAHQKWLEALALLDGEKGGDGAS